jgi:hypothetical protein
MPVRKYWHCLNQKGQHLMCEGDLQYKAEKEWCDFPDNVQCGDRPLCDECDQDCVTEPPGPDCGPADHHPADICKGRPPGYYPDMFNCIKYWVCNGELGTHMMCPEGQAWDAVKVRRIISMHDSLLTRAIGATGSDRWSAGSDRSVTSVMRTVSRENATCRNVSWNYIISFNYIILYSG